jgi:hypothetical protein
MENVVYLGESLKDFGTQQSMGIGDDAEPH